jgi:hypothetical protein
MSLSTIISRKIEQFKMNRDYKRQRRRANSPHRVSLYLQSSEKNKKN